MVYVPRTLPPFSGDTGELGIWIAEELRTISRSLTTVETIQLVVLHVEPTRPRDGMVAYADGTDWNPGAGEGPYAYLNGAWTKLFP